MQKWKLIAKPVKKECHEFSKILGKLSKLFSKFTVMLPNLLKIFAKKKLQNSYIILIYISEYSDL